MRGVPARQDGNGKVVQIAVIGPRLTNIEVTLIRMERKQDEEAKALAEWQRATESRLATGAEKFRQLEQRDGVIGTLNAVGTVIGSV